MKKHILLTVLLTLALALSACGAKSELDSNREKWEGQSVTHYRFDLTIACFCPFRSVMPVKVEVLDGKIVSITDINGQPLDDLFRSTFEEAGTVENLFALAEENLANADKVEIVYDATYGFPASIVVDRIEMAMDDEISYFVENFEVLE
jgi:hypothetical protein